MELIINQLDRNTDGDIVTTIHWTATKTDGEFTASTYASMAVEIGDEFIPYDELTEDIVIQWVSDKLDLESLEASLDSQLEDQKQPKVATGLPW